MAKDDGDDGLPPLGENTDKFLEDAKKGKPRGFLLICKGTKVRYLSVRKKPIKKAEVSEAKKLGYKGDAYFGTITGKGIELVFNLLKEEYDAEPVKPKALKDFLEEHAGLKAHPSFMLVDSLPSIPFDEEDLKHPLVAKFLQMDTAISQILDQRSGAQAELTARVATIRELLQDGAFNDAAPMIDQLVARLNELSQDAEEPPPPPPPLPLASAQPDQPTARQPTASQNDERRAKLIEVLNHLTPQLKQAIAAQPARKSELIGQVALIKQQIEQRQYDEAQQGLLAIGQLLKEMLAQTIASGATQTPPNADQEKSDVTQRLKAIKPRYLEVMQTAPPNQATLEKAMTAIVNAAKNAQYAQALKLLGALERALAGAPQKPTTGIAPEVREAWLTARELAGAGLTKLQEALRGDPDPRFQQIADKGLNGITGKLQVKLEVALRELERNPATRQTVLVAIADFRKFLAENPLVELCDDNPYEVAVGLRTILIPALNSLEQALNA